MKLEQFASTWSDFQRQARENVRVLVVDDEPAICELLHHALSDDGYVVTTAGDAETGWRDLQAHNYDLAIVDKNLPGASGLELIKWIAASDKVIPSVLITAYPSADTIMSALGAGAADYVVKPFDDLEHFMSRIRGIIDHRLTHRLHSKVVGDLTWLLKDGGKAEDRLLIASVAGRLQTFKQGLDARPGVLLVEENPTVGGVMKKALTDAGLTVELEASLDAALARTGQEDAPVCVVASIDQQKDVSAITALRKRDPAIEIVVTSGSSDLTLALSAVGAGAADYVLRHFEGTRMLRTRVKRAVARARRRRLYLFLIATLYRTAVEAGYEVDALLAQRQGEHEPPPPDEALPTTEAPPPAPESVDLPALLATDEVEDEAEPETPGREGAEPTPDSGPDRRAHPRHDAEMDVRYMLTGGGMEFLYSHMKDISKGGMFVVMKEPADIGVLLTVEIVQGPGGAPVKVLGEVVRRVPPDPATGTGGGVGVRFVGGDRGGLMKLLEEVASGVVEG